MPFPVIDLNLLQEIIFQDIDVYNEDLKVTISNLNFEVSAEKLGDSGMNKQFKLSMKPTVTITQPETLTITVTVSISISHLFKNNLTIPSIFVKTRINLHRQLQNQ